MRAERRRPTIRQTIKEFLPHMPPRGSALSNIIVGGTVATIDLGVAGFALGEKGGTGGLVGLAADVVFTTAVLLARRRREPKTRAVRRRSSVR